MNIGDRVRVLIRSKTPIRKCIDYRKVYEIISLYTSFTGNKCAKLNGADGPYPLGVCLDDLVLEED